MQEVQLVAVAVAFAFARGNLYDPTLVFFIALALILVVGSWQPSHFALRVVDLTFSWTRDADAGWEGRVVKGNLAARASPIQRGRSMISDLTSSGRAIPFRSWSSSDTHRHQPTILRAAYHGEAHLTAHLNSKLRDKLYVQNVVMTRKA